MDCHVIVIGVEFGHQAGPMGADTPGGVKLRALRERHGRTQLWVEVEAELGTGYLQRLESGRVVQPGRSTLERILGALGARYTERRQVLEVFGYTVATPQPDDADRAWAYATCQRELREVLFPAYALDCTSRLVAWNGYLPRLLGVAADDSLLAWLAERSVLAAWFDRSSPLAALVVEPAAFLPALIRALRYEMQQIGAEPWAEAWLARMRADLPRFRDYWDTTEQEPASAGAARALVPVRLAVPGVGELQFRLSSEPFAQDARFRIIYYFPADPITMQQCAEWAARA
jgi:transcriptional regulator with XRE-family HTH domain